MVDIIMVRRGASLHPASAADLEELDKIRQGRPALCAIKFPRSLQHHRWWRALVGVVAEGLGVNHDALHAEIKLKAGLVSHMFLHQGRAMTELKSTAFANMDEIEFTAFTRLGVEIIFRDYLPTVDRDTVFDRVRELVGDFKPDRDDDKAL